jgi:fused signal recognition particle receptor
VKERLRGLLLEILSARAPVFSVDAAPAVVLVVGVNGTGKTTSIGKLARRLQAEGKKVMLAAADTFRAAAAEQLSIWGERAGVPVIKHQEGADPGAVAFDAAQAAKARQIDVLIVDTAGRLHTKSNLMEELKKVKRILSRELPGAPHETLLVLDGSTGQNALVQARMFNEAIGITGIVLTKLDGTSKGGIVFAINKELAIPVKFVGIGEAVEDLRGFDPKEFVDALF